MAEMTLPPVAKTIHLECMRSLWFSENLQVAFKESSASSVGGSCCEKKRSSCSSKEERSHR